MRVLPRAPQTKYTLQHISLQEKGRILPLLKGAQCCWRCREKNALHLTLLGGGAAAVVNGQPLFTHSKEVQHHLQRSQQHSEQ